MQDKEPIYNEVIKPLIDHLYDLCQEHGIPFLAGFEVSEEVIAGSYSLSGSETDQLRLAALVLEANISVGVAATRGTMQPVKVVD
jgi:hypothetical protein